MQVSEPNDVKIYNLSAGKSLPEWLSERKRRSLLKKNVDIKRRIELIQDFDMPGLSTTIRVSRDGNYILASGIYKPRIKCFDVNNLSLKFERCFDSEAVTFEVLSDDYSKLVFLQCDRYIEFHAAYGRYYRLRIPKFGRDLQYHYPSCDLFIVGASSEIYRLNLERGQFMTPFSSEATEINKCAINSVHNLLVCGTQEGRVEAWDPRIKERVGVLDCAFTCVTENKELQGFPSISSLKFNDALQLGVGTTTGQILLYDIRSDKPFITKDHMYGLPIKNVEFHYQNNIVYSLDNTILKLWDKNSGNLYTSIEASTEFNDLCLVPNTGLFFLANESTKMQTYYIPSLGPAPKWASFLDSLTEELEESHSETVYDDYKFVTKQELGALGLDHLIGTKLLRAYMHGYFLDVRLYKKAKSLADPLAFEEYRKKKIRETIEKEMEDRIQVSKLPKVNKDLALKLMTVDEQIKKKNNSSAILQDSRFKALFENPDFEVDKNTEEYRLLNPVLSKLNKPDKSDSKMRLYEIKHGESFKGIESFKGKVNKVSLGERLNSEDVSVKLLGSVGNREMTFSTQKKRKSKLEEIKKRHRDERKRLIRPTFKIKSKRNPFNKR
ncbi:nucleolar protein 10 [Sitophilus oryzae]|uniref:Nucleolar protein 10 n=1 Tax=Sitophilus oryzae TaxID=7048 RepID=A0A6J2XQC2_SITOR|nr:nucleolar protein 10 [Sitophilus oryzae]